MSQNNPTGGSSQGQGTSSSSGATATGGAGTGATDAGTTRASGAASTGSTSGAGSTGSGGGQSMTPSTGTGTAAGRSSTAQEYGQKITDAATQAKDYVSDKMSVVTDKIKDIQNRDFNEVANEAKEYARQKPGQAILISAAAGLVLGLLIRGSRR